MMHAAANGNLEIVALLVERGANMDTKSKVPDDGYSLI